MRRFCVLVVLFAAAAFTVSSLTADEPKKEDAKKLSSEEIAKMMKNVHRGEKSAYSRTQAELKKDTPDWDQIAKGVKDFSDMGAALKGNVAYTSPAKYIASTEALAKAAKDKDKKAATEAFAGLTNSCGACHYGGARAMLK